MAESEEALQLKRRARRRLVGAVALVTFVVIILPLILDKEPGPAGPPLSVQIPNQESGGFTTRVAPLATPVPAAPAPEKNAGIPVAKTEAPPPVVAAPVPKVEPAVMDKAPAPKAEAVVANKAPPDQKRVPAEAWGVALDAFSDAKNVKQLRARLTAAGVKSYTEPVKTSKGELTRVRAGPFPSREAAEKARAKLQGMGLKPGAVASR